MKKKHSKREEPSKLYYLLPIFLGIIGGVVGYFLLKDRDRKFAERLLIIGLIMIAVWWVASFLFSVLAYMYISGAFTARTQWIELIDSSCSAGVVNIRIKNMGTTDIGANEIGILRSLPEAEPDTPSTCCDSPIGPGESVWYIDSTCGSAKSCTYRITPSAGKTITATQYCT